MKSCEEFVAPESDYFVYAPSRLAQTMFLYPPQCGLFLTSRDIRYEEIRLTVFC